MQKLHLQEHINCFIDERIEESRNKIYNTYKYKKILNSSYNLFDKIEAVVDNTSLTDTYKDVESELSFILLKEAYKMGFKDSMQIFLYNQI